MSKVVDSRRHKAERWDSITPHALIGAAVVLATLAVLAIKLEFARQVVFCGGADACFYFALAKELAGRGDFLLDFVWNYQVDKIALPSMALDYWRPGTSFLLDLAMPFGDVTLRTSAVIATLATECAALASAYLAWKATRDSGVTLLSYLICLCLPPFWTTPLTPDATAFYAAAVAWFLALFTVESRGRVCDLLGVGCIGLAYLIRNDAIVLGVPFAAVLAQRLINGFRQGAPRKELRNASILVGAVLVALTPTHVLTYLASGKFFNSSIMQVMFFSSLQDFSRYGDPMTFSAWLADGVMPILKLRILAIAQALHHLLVLYSEPATVLALIAVGFFLVKPGRAAFWRVFLGPLAFLVSIFACYTLAIPAIGAHALLRSYMGFLPCVAFLAALGIRQITASWRAFIMLAGGVLFFSLIDGINGARTLLMDNREALTEYRAEADIIKKDVLASARGPIAMVQNPAPFTTTTGIPSIPLPTNGLSPVRGAIARFGVTHIVVDKWDGGSELVKNLHPIAIEEVPNSRKIVISLPNSSSRPVSDRGRAPEGSRDIFP